jgi:hypothetical protein
MLGALVGALVIAGFLVAPVVLDEDFDGSDLAETSATHLCPAALATARNTALRLDRHGYQVSPHVYGRTAHARQTLHAPAC